MRDLGMILLGVPIGYLLRIAVGIAKYRAYVRRFQRGEK